MKKKSNYEKGSKKLHLTHSLIYEKKDMLWRNTNTITSTSKQALELFEKHQNSHLLVDENLSNFTKGHLTPQGNISGARIKVLPCGTSLARGGFSLFAKDLTFNLGNHSLWDVSYTNPSGSKTYLYSEKKVHLEQEQKYLLVQEFMKKREFIYEKLKYDILSTQEEKYLALYILLETAIRVGNIHSFYEFGHKGLTTLQKKDISLHQDILEFHFIAKDGVPQHFLHQLPSWYLEVLSEIYHKKKKNDFLFSHVKGQAFHSEDFSKILFSYTDVHFYPHIIRSYYANEICENFLEEVGKKLITKEQAQEIFEKVAQKLGHKKYNKKKELWELDYKVSIANYIYPKNSEKIMKKIKK